MRIIAPATWWLALQWADATPPCIFCIGHGCQGLLRRNTDTEREFMGLSRESIERSFPGLRRKEAWHMHLMASSQPKLMLATRSPCAVTSSQNE